MILALDASSGEGSAALVDAGRLLRATTFHGGRARGAGAVQALQDVGSEPGIRAVIVGLGPGSYNGIRSSVAAAWGFAAARRIPLHGVSSLLALGMGEYWAAGDARQGQFYLARVKEGGFVMEPKLLTPAELQRHLASSAQLPVLTPSDITSLLPESIVTAPNASMLVGYCPQDLPEQPVWPEMPQPLYLKPPHITPTQSLVHVTKKFSMKH